MKTNFNETMNNEQFEVIVVDGMNFNRFDLVLVGLFDEWIVINCVAAAAVVFG